MIYTSHNSLQASHMHSSQTSLVLSKLSCDQAPPSPSHQTQVHSLPHTCLSSTHSSTSTTEQPMVSSLHCLSSFQSDNLTSPLIHPLFESNNLTSSHHQPTLYKSRSISPKTHLAKIHPLTHKQPKCYSHYLRSDLSLSLSLSLYIYIYVYLYIKLFI